MQKKLARLYPLFLIGLIPAATVFAQTRTVDQILTDAKNILNAIIVILFILESVLLIWGIIKLIAGGPEAQKGGKAFIGYSIVGMAITIGAWALARILLNFFIQGGDTTAPDARTIIK